MKKFLILALCAAAAGSMFAQKANVDAAKKLAGKVDKIGEARTLIQAALADPETMNDPNTYFVAGKIEYDAFDKNEAARKINPADVNLLDMYRELLNGYNYYAQGIPVDAASAKPKLGKDMAKTIASHATQYFEGGANFFNEKVYYPEAYQAFMIYGDLSDQTDLLGKATPALPRTDRATAYFNAGLAAYSGNQVEKSAGAFRKARNAGYTDPQAFIYEIACWQNLAQNDSTKADLAKQNIRDVAMDGYRQFGIEQPLFINNLVNYMVSDNQTNEALELISGEIANHPDAAALYGLRGFVYDRADNEAASEADYRKAVSLPGVDYETLKNAAKKILRIGTEKWNTIEGNSAEARAARQDVKTNYFETAKAITEQAKALNGVDSDLEYVIENIDYALETYFN
ncbi:MAG: hypothetical protein K2O24_06850 [Muribaculaceae bacterium]|nr:hypothetical protein [Muribaculaceae bacterium]